MLLSKHTGQYMAISSKNNLVINDDEAVVRRLAERTLRSATEDYFLECLGCEVLCEVYLSPSFEKPTAESAMEWKNEAGDVAATETAPVPQLQYAHARM